MKRRAFLGSLLLGVTVLPSLAKAVTTKPRRLGPWQTVICDDFRMDVGDSSYDSYYTFVVKDTRVKLRFGFTMDKLPDGRQRTTRITRITLDDSREVRGMDMKIDMPPRTPISQWGSLVTPIHIVEPPDITIRWREMEST